MRSIKQLNSFEEWTFITEHENIVKFEAEPYILIYGFGLKYILACTPIKKHNWNQNDWWLDDRSDCLYKTWLKSVIKLMDILAKHQEYCEWKLILMPLTYTWHRNNFFTYVVGWLIFWKFWTIKKLIKPLKDIYPWITKLVSKWT